MELLGQTLVSSFSFPRRPAARWRLLSQSGFFRAGWEPCGHACLNWVIFVRPSLLLPSKSKNSSSFYFYLRKYEHEKNLTEQRRKLCGCCWTLIFSGIYAARIDRHEREMRNRKERKSAPSSGSLNLLKKNVTRF